MSAYMLSDEDYQLIADWLLENANDTGSHHCYNIRAFVGIDRKSEKIRLVSCDELKDYIRMKMRSLYNLNRIAMVTRYGEKYDREDKVQFVPKIRSGTIFDKEVISKLKSLRYQCAEYIASDTGEFIDLDKFIGKLCENFFNSKE